MEVLRKMAGTGGCGRETACNDAIVCVFALPVGTQGRPPCTSGRRRSSPRGLCSGGEGAAGGAGRGQEGEGREAVDSESKRLD